MVGWLVPGPLASKLRVALNEASGCAALSNPSTQTPTRSPRVGDQTKSHLHRAV